MSKPIRDVQVTAANGKRFTVKAVLDSGSYHSIVRKDVLPAGTPLLPFPGAKDLRTAGRGGRVRIQGVTYFILRLEGKLIGTYALVSPDLHQPMLVGAQTMQSWDITIRNRNGKTQVLVGRDMRDPDITEVD